MSVRTFLAYVLFSAFDGEIYSGNSRKRNIRLGNAPDTIPLQSLDYYCYNSIYVY